MDGLKYLYFSCASGIFTFGIVPLLWIGSLFVARINRPQIIKSVLFLLMYGHFIFYSIISLTIIDAEIRLYKNGLLRTVTDTNSEKLSVSVCFKSV